MSEFKGKILVGAVLAVIIAVGLAVAVMLAAPQAGSSTSQNQQQSITSTSLLSGKSVLVVQLTDPPIVPAETTALNLTYSDISLLVSEPSTTTSMTSSVSTSDSITTTITSTITQTQSGVLTQPQFVKTGQSGTVNLLRLQNVSQTLASANLPNGSTIYSVNFTVSSISITINGTTYPVTLATGSTSLLVTLAKPAMLNGTSAMLVDLTPTIVNTTSGYQMIPSAVGIMKTNVSEQEQHIGHEQAISNQDNQEIHHAMGQISASLVALSVSGNVTTLEVNVTNTGSANVSLAMIGIHGNFTAQDAACTTTSTTSNNGIGGQYQSPDHHPWCKGGFGPQDLVFFPNSTLSPSTTKSNCETGTVDTALGAMTDNYQGNNNYQGVNNHHVELAPGSCAVLTFTGTITSGYHGIVEVPSTLSGQQYIVQVVASNSTPVMLNCTLPISSTSCTPLQYNFGHAGGN